MIHCPSCNHKELSGALFCSQCGTQLIQVKDEDQPDIQNATVENISSAVIPPFPTRLENTFDSNVALLIMDEDDLIPIDGEGEFTLGRFTQGQTILPDVDLSPYQAYESGVSRLHANIHLDDTGVRIRDLGSANGPRLNGRRLEPNQKNLLKNGDILTLGKLKIQVLIKG